MKFEYTGRHVEVTPALRQHVEEHFSKLEHIFDDSTASAHIIIEVEKNRHMGEVLLHWREHTLTARDTNADMYQALSRAIAKIEKQAVKLKKKIIDRKQSAQPLSTLAPDNGSTEDGVEEAAPASGRIISARRYAVKPMTPEEAVIRLGEDSNQFILFRNSDTDRLSVLYKRKDGNFGLIQP
ncbi:MAG TPA: ribosome-associated translation inhibitor RaiA [Pyrinomonadaceae bacterium]|jgi:putative sigma-54 modulation protein|nr:ribosome-associated translation inhibitor RaiA [Pyrinomonadaceae bacterium]